MIRRTFALTLAATLYLFMTVAAWAADAPGAKITRASASKSITVDIEVDPIAYVFSGYSLHAGLRWKRFRLDLGAFALQAPEALHGAEGLEVYGSGFGAKLDYHLFDSRFFVGAQLNRVREDVSAADGSGVVHATNVTVGGRIGYRFDIAEDFYAVPWIGVDYAFADRTRVVAGQEYKPGRVMFFPTLHIGKMF